VSDRIAYVYAIDIDNRGLVRRDDDTGAKGGLDRDRVRVAIVDNVGLLDCRDDKFSRGGGP
jgi:hypothetical protein